MKEKLHSIFGPKYLPLRFFSSFDITKIPEGSSDFGYHLKKYLATFNNTLKLKNTSLPFDYSVTQQRMKLRIERCCLLFKERTRIVCALHDLRDLALYIKKIRPILIPISGLTYCHLNLAFDLDHVFLLEYKLKTGRVLSLKGFHADYMGEIECLGKTDSYRLVIEKTGLTLRGINEVIIVLNKKRSAKKTLFPQNWNWLTCLNKAFEALGAIIRVGKTRTGELVINGLSKDSIAIEFIIDAETGLVKTFYPTIEVTRKVDNVSYNNTKKRLI